MQLHDKQRDIVRSDARFKIVRAGRRSGKTTLWVEGMCFDAMTGKDRNVFYIAPTQTQARDIIWLMLRRRLTGVANFNEQRLEVIVPTEDSGKSLIKLAGWENRENFRGKSAYSLTFDEVDTMRDFFVGWHDIFRPTLIDTGGEARFGGTPKKENPNLRRLEMLAEKDPNYAAFHFNTFDNPFLPETERQELINEYKDNHDAYRQEILAEHISDAGALFRYESLLDVFSNTITKDGNKYLIVDIADDGTDKTVFSLWDGLEEYKREEYARLNTESVIAKIRETAHEHRVPFSHIAVDAIGVGAGVASSSFLDGIIGYKSSYAPIKTDVDIVRLPNVHYRADAPLVSEYKNLRSQCVFTLADYINNHKIASRVTGEFKERVIEELGLYQDASRGDGKRLATLKEDVRELLGRSPDHSDTWIMRMYFEVRGRVAPGQTEAFARVIQQQDAIFRRNKNALKVNQSI